MTNRYPPDPRDEVRAGVVGRECAKLGSSGHNHPANPCVECGGSGWVPSNDQREIEVREFSWPVSVGASDIRIGGGTSWRWKLITDLDWKRDQHQPTKDEALLAARCAVWGVGVLQYQGEQYDDTNTLRPEWTGQWCWYDSEYPDEGSCGPYTTTEAALCAAIDAREK